MCRTEPGRAAGPRDLMAASRDWVPLDAPTTVAAGLRAAGRWFPDSARLDEEEWWFHATLPARQADANTRFVLGLDGLATIADVWVDGRPVLSTDNMFLRHEVPLGPAGSPTDLVIRCAPIAARLQTRRPRPRWRAPLVAHQQLRWIRTSLLGRMPGWSPLAPAVGPWAGVWIERRQEAEIRDVRLRTELRDGAGMLDVACTVVPIGGATIQGGRVDLIRDGSVAGARLERRGGHEFAARVEVSRPDLWWPHTHGESATYDVRLALDVEGGDRRELVVDAGAVGFRTLELDRADDGFEFHVNGVRVFCRGACWTPLDPLALSAAPDEYRTALRQVTSAGMNMLRLSGATVYETDAFHDACDEAGVLVWQDLMFANMDYPGDDETFLASVRCEAAQQLGRLQARPSLALICGNSEVGQQAAMWGAPREAWTQPMFSDALPSIAASICPGVPYCPSSSDGGAFPHQVNAGSTSYFGVSAYRRPLDDARRSGVRFAAECLAFANIPEDATIATMPGGRALRVHHPAWKAATPRDLGAGWDFEDIRDHYVARLFRVDPTELRYADHERYLAFGRVAAGEVMAATFAEWRRAGSVCAGGLIWFLRDLVPGAGWGVIDARGAEKAPYHYLRRALQPVAVSVTDEGCSGLFLHAVNDSGRAIDGTLHLDLFQAGEVAVGSGAEPVVIAPRSAISRSAIALLPEFRDLSYAFRFGPPSVDVVHVRLVGGDGAQITDAFHFPLGYSRRRESDIGLVASAAEGESGRWSLSIRARAFAQAVRIDALGFRPADQYFHLAPGSQRTIRLDRTEATSSGPPRGMVQALNCDASARIGGPR